MKDFLFMFHVFMFHQPAHMSLPDTSSCPHVRLRGVPLRAFRWAGGFWGARLEQCRDVMVPAMGRLMQETERARFVGNFAVAAGLEQGRHRGPRWNDGDFYKWLEAAAALQALFPDAQRDAEMDRLIELIGKAQRPDGYIHTDIQIRQRQGEQVQPFADPMDFEMYNMGHLMSAACVHHRATGKGNLLELACRAADFLDGEFARPTAARARHGICPAHLMGLAELYRVTGERRYIDLAVRLLNMRDNVVGGDDDNQDRVPLRQHRRIVGHAVRANYLYAGVADIHAETGEEALLTVLRSTWEDLVAHKLYITGGCGALYDGASPDGAVDQKTISRVHQAYGRDFQLPHSTAHNETCAAIGSVLWSWRMLLITGESRYGDLIEQTLYNAVLAGVGLDGQSYFYTNTLRQLEPMPVELRWPRHRARSMSCWCCPPNVVRTIAQCGGLAYATSPRGVHAVLYGSGRLERPELTLVQQTDYPWDGRVHFTIEKAPAGEWSLLLRIPAWARGAAVDGTAAEPGTFHEVRRRWQAGDAVELDLPMPVRLVEAHPYVEEARNQAAVMRGPLVYCLESADLPPGVRVLDVYLRTDARLAPARFDGLPGGVVAIEGKALAYGGGWAGGLYRDLTTMSPREIDLRLVPYYAWDNRGPGEMTVWMPLAR